MFSSLKMKPDVVLRHLSIAVAATDQSYMPQQVTVAVGRSASELQEVRDVHIPSNVTGYVTLLENANISQLCESTKMHLGLLTKRIGRGGSNVLQEDLSSKKLFLFLWRSDLLLMMYMKMVIISPIQCF